MKLTNVHVCFEMKHEIGFYLGFIMPNVRLMTIRIQGFYFEVLEKYAVFPIIILKKPDIKFQGE